MVGSTDVGAPPPSFEADMIVVTGTWRSGTSLWMQVLHAAGLPVIGDRFPERFAALRAANPAGFWESRLRWGVFHATNPDRETGIYLHPADTQRHAVKVFIPGLIRTDRAYLDRVIATVRPWREYVASRARMHAIEADARRASSSQRGKPRLERHELRPPAELEWWNQMYQLIQDIVMRRYPVHLVTYARLLDAPEDELAAVLKWIGEGELAAAVAVVRPELQSQYLPDLSPEHVDADAVAVFDDLYHAIHVDRALSPALIDRMNALAPRLAREFPPSPEPPHGDPTRY